MFKKFISILFIMCSIQTFANELANPKRIESILPKGTALNIEPYVPNDFVFVELMENNYLWMPDGLFEKYVKDEKAAHPPFIHIVLMKGFPQEDNNQDVVEKCIAEMRQLFPVQASSSNWGKYKVNTIKFNSTDDDEYMAFVNLNKDGHYIVFHLAYHKKLDHGNGNKPSKKELDFWNDFLNKTKSL